MTNVPNLRCNLCGAVISCDISGHNAECLGINGKLGGSGVDMTYYHGAAKCRDHICKHCLRALPAVLDKLKADEALT